MKWHKRFQHQFPPAIILGGLLKRYYLNDLNMTSTSVLMYDSGFVNYFIQKRAWGLRWY